MNRVLFSAVVILTIACVLLEAVVPAHDDLNFPGRYVVISAIGFVGLVFLSKVVLPLLLTQPEDHDVW